MTRVAEGRELVDWARSVPAPDGEFLGGVLRPAPERLVEAAEAVVCLCSEAASCVVGDSLIVDGGRSSDVR